MESGSDEELARKASAGDGAAFATLVERYGPELRRVARGVLLDPHDADDATQDGLLAAWQKLDRYDPRRPFRPWIVRIILNAARDSRRRRKVRRVEPLGAELRAGDRPPDQVTDQALLRERLAQALAEVPERQRTAVVLFDAEGYSHREIAEILGCPVGTVRSLVHHGRRALRAALGPPGPEGFDA